MTLVIDRKSGRQHHHRRPRRQGVERNGDRATVVDDDLELVFHAVKELRQRGLPEGVHRQHQAGLECLQHLDHLADFQGEAAVDRRHHDVEPAEQGVMRLGQAVMQVAEMADAQVSHLKDEDRVGVLLRRAPGADVGGDVADGDIAEPQQVPGGAGSIRVPAAQHMGDGRVREIGEMGLVGLVHGHHVRQPALSAGAEIIGGDDHALLGFDPEGRMADIGDGDLAGAGGDIAKSRIAHPRHALDEGVAVAG